MQVCVCLYVCACTCVLVCMCVCVCMHVCVGHCYITLLSNLSFSEHTSFRIRLPVSFISHAQASVPFLWRAQKNNDFTRQLLCLHPPSSQVCQFLSTIEMCMRWSSAVKPDSLELKENDVYTLFLVLRTCVVYPSFCTACVLSTLQTRIKASVGRWFIPCLTRVAGGGQRAATLVSSISTRMQGLRPIQFPELAPSILCPQTVWEFS